MDILAFSDADGNATLTIANLQLGIVFILEPILLLGLLINKKLSLEVVQRQSTKA